MPWVYQSINQNQYVNLSIHLSINISIYQSPQGGVGYLFLKYVFYLSIHPSKKATFNWHFDFFLERQTDTNCGLQGSYTSKNCEWRGRGGDLFLNYVFYQSIHQLKKTTLTWNFDIFFERQTNIHCGLQGSYTSKGEKGSHFSQGWQYKKKIWSRGLFESGFFRAQIGLFYEIFIYKVSMPPRIKKCGRKIHFLGVNKIL